MIGAYHVFAVLTRKISIPISILGNKNKMTSGIWSKLNIPGANGTVNDSLNSDANYLNAQIAALLSISATDGFFNECKKHIYNKFN